MKKIKKHLLIVISILAIMAIGCGKKYEGGIVPSLYISQGIIPEDIEELYSILDCNDLTAAGKEEITDKKVIDTFKEVYSSCCKYLGVEKKIPEIYYCNSQEFSWAFYDSSSQIIYIQKNLFEDDLGKISLAHEIVHYLSHNENMIGFMDIEDGTSIYEWNFFNEGMTQVLAEKAIDEKKERIYPFQRTFALNMIEIFGENELKKAFVSNDSSIFDEMLQRMNEVYPDFVYESGIVLHNSDIFFRQMDTIGYLEIYSTSLSIEDRYVVAVLMNSLFEEQIIMANEAGCLPKVRKNIHAYYDSWYAEFTNADTKELLKY